MDLESNHFFCFLVESCVGSPAPVSRGFASASRQALHAQFPRCSPLGLFGTEVGAHREENLPPVLQSCVTSSTSRLIFSAWIQTSKRHRLLAQLLSPSSMGARNASISQTGVTNVSTSLIPCRKREVVNICHVRPTGAVGKVSSSSGVRLSQTGAVRFLEDCKFTNIVFDLASSNSRFSCGQYKQIL